MTTRQSKLCYMCESPGSTREHVPPLAFFPKTLRKNLWTVPSCSEHNHDNNLDVEYVRNVISTQRGTNPIAENVLAAAKRSWDYRPALFNRTFREFGVTQIEGEETGIFPFDLQRVKTIMDAIVHALSYRDFGRKYIGEWHVFSATLLSRKPAPDWDSLRKMLSGASYQPIEVPVPKVFQYGIHRARPIGFIYRLIFYEGFVVYAWPSIKTDT